MDKRITKRVLDTKGYTVTTGAVVTLTDFGFDTGTAEAATALVVSTTANLLMLTIDGTDPTSTLGHPVSANEWGAIDTLDSQAIKLIAVGGNAPTTITLLR